MSPTINRLLLQLGRWPRRIAVVLCLAFAVASSVGGKPSSGTRAADPLSRLGPSQVAVPVTLSQSGTDGVLSTGDRVGLLSANTMIADHLLVLRVAAVPAGEDGTVSLLVAADRPTALRIARTSGQTVLAVVDKSP